MLHLWFLLWRFYSEVLSCFGPFTRIAIDRNPLYPRHGMSKRAVSSERSPPLFEVRGSRFYTDFRSLLSWAEAEGEDDDQGWSGRARRLSFCRPDCSCSAGRSS